MLPKVDYAAFEITLVNLLHTLLLVEFINCAKVVDVCKVGEVLDDLCMKLPGKAMVDIRWLNCGVNNFVHGQMRTRSIEI